MSHERPRSEDVGERLLAVRLDKWLWAARFYKTRALAAEACDGGKVEVNGQTAKPHRLIRVHDRLSLTHPGGRKEVVVLALSERRGPATEARLLYEDHSPPQPAEGFFVPPPLRSPGSGRPSKRERREIARLRGR